MQGISAQQLCVDDSLQQRWIGVNLIQAEIVKKDWYLDEPFLPINQLALYSNFTWIVAMIYCVI